jgi:hypothetical protein
MLDNEVLKSLKNKEGYINGISNSFHPFMRRQDLPKPMLVMVLFILFKLVNSSKMIVF